MNGWHGQIMVLICHLRMCCVGMPEDGEVTNNTNADALEAPATDIGRYLHCRLTPYQQHTLLTNHVKPCDLENFEYPFIVRSNKGKDEKRYVREEHLNKHPWLQFSPTANGLFCIPCAIFMRANGTAGIGDQRLGQLVTKPLQNYTHLLGNSGYLSRHANSDYHSDSLARADTFLDNFNVISALTNAPTNIYKCQTISGVVPPNPPAGTPPPQHGPWPCAGTARPFVRHQKCAPPLQNPRSATGTSYKDYSA